MLGGPAADQVPRGGAGAGDVELDVGGDAGAEHRLVVRPVAPVPVLVGAGDVVADALAGDLAVAHRDEGDLALVEGSDFRAAVQRRRLGGPDGLEVRRQGLDGGSVGGGSGRRGGQADEEREDEARDECHGGGGTPAEWHPERAVSPDVGSKHRRTPFGSIGIGRSSYRTVAWRQLICEYLSGEVPINRRRACERPRCSRRPRPDSLGPTCPQCSRRTRGEALDPDAGLQRGGTDRGRPQAGARGRLPVRDRAGGRRRRQPGRHRRGPRAGPTTRGCG